MLLLILLSAVESIFSVTGSLFITGSLFLTIGSLFTTESLFVTIGSTFTEVVSIFYFYKRIQTALNTKTFDKLILNMLLHHPLLNF